MLLDDLVGVIETLKGRIAAHGASLRENETRTRMALIDPLLQALGWDVSDPSVVTPEYSVGASRVDYALLTPTGNPSALVEAKKLDESLASHRMQMLNYANISGIPHAGLTDGNHWEMYTVFDQAPIEQRRILDVSIANTPAHEATLKLLLLWRPNLASGRPVAANAPVLTEVPSTLSEVARPITETVTSTGIIQAPVTSQLLTSDVGWKSLAGISYQQGDKKPTGIRFHDAAETDPKDIKSWADMWGEICEWLCVNGWLSARDCPVPSPKGKGVRVLVNTTAQHPASRKNPDGKNFFQPRKTSTGLFVETNYNPQGSIGNAKFLLDQIGIPAETVELRFG